MREMEADFMIVEDSSDSEEEESVEVCLEGRRALCKWCISERCTSCGVLLSYTCKNSSAASFSNSEGW